MHRRTTACVDSSHTPRDLRRRRRRGLDQTVLNRVCQLGFYFSKLQLFIEKWTQHGGQLAHNTMLDHGAAICLDCDTSGCADPPTALTSPWLRSMWALLTSLLHGPR